MAAGAESISAIPLHLRPGVREHYLAWLAANRPDLMALYEQRFGTRAYQPKAVAAALSAQVLRLVRDAERSSGRDRRPHVVDASDNDRRRILTEQGIGAEGDAEAQPLPVVEQLGLGL